VFYIQYMFCNKIQFYNYHLHFLYLINVFYYSIITILAS